MIRLKARPLSALKDRVLRGEVGVLPTDTLYGLSGDGLSDDVVGRINHIKRRAQPVTLIPPSEEWAVAMCAPARREALRTLVREMPGETLLVPYGPDDDDPTPRPAAAVTTTGLVGLRWPRHWISDLAREAGVPLVTTSVNRTGEPPLEDPAALADDLAAEVDFLVDEGPLQGRPSKLVFVAEDPPRVVVR